uniref:Fc receptor-like protein 6 isoform X2 n=1 Tax=Phascolarctos cinereus TaxID=38626 RepID=A0A6P5JQ75_PHACI|nr:Fc receptor-like protein 6 isoform X2 [Phascolarctos cinereus]
MLLKVAVLLLALFMGKSDWLILQAPYSVFEGDAVILQCKGWRKAELSKVTFHKWRKPIYFTKENKPLSIKAANIEDRGQYSCSGYMRNGNIHENSEPVILQVQELFPRPELRIKNSTEAVSGSLTTLSCETQLTPQRSASRLYFSFYKDNSTIRSRDQSPEYCIPATIMAGAGFYWCVAATEDGQVQKQSLGLEIQGSTTLPSVPVGHRRSQLVLGITLALFGMIGITAVFLHYFRLLKKAEGTAAPDPARGPFFPGTPEAVKASSSQDLESCPVYANVNPQDTESGDVLYSVVFSRKQRKKTLSKDPSLSEEDSSVIYSSLVLPQNQKLSPGKGYKYRRSQAPRQIRPRHIQERMTILPWCSLILPHHPSSSLGCPSERLEKDHLQQGSPSPSTQKMKLNLSSLCKE